MDFFIQVWFIVHREMPLIRSGTISLVYFGETDYQTFLVLHCHHSPLSGVQLKFLLFQLIHLVTLTQMQNLTYIICYLRVN